MGAPKLWQRFRQTCGRAVRETGQALDRLGLRLASVSQTKYDFGDEPVRFQDHLSRHRQLFPLLAAGRPVLHPQVAYVAPCATLIGSVVVGQGASIWYGAVLRADTTAHAESFNKSDEELLQPTINPVVLLESSNNTDSSAVKDEKEDGDGEKSTSAIGPFELPDPERTPYSGGGIVIGQGTNIQDGCILSARKGHCIVGQGVTVGHLAQIHSATVGDFSLVGMGSILHEGSRIGSESFVAAGAVIGPGVVVPSGELWVGNPARKLRDLSEKERAKLHYQSSEYEIVASSHRGSVIDPEEKIEAGEDKDTTPKEVDDEQITAQASGR